MNRFNILVLASVALSGLGLAASAATKSTTTSTTTTTTTTTTEESMSGKEAKAARKGHCLTSLTKTENATACYDTFTELVAAATGGKITDAPADVAVAMQDKELLKQLNASTDKKQGPANGPKSGADVLVLTIFCDDHYTGCTFGAGSTSWVGPACSDTLNDIDSSIAYVGDDWNDDFESFIAYNNCYAKVFEHANFGGASTPWAGALPDFGVLNDEGSSIQLS